MRRLILVGVLGLALPAFAAEEHTPSTTDTAAEQVAPASEATSAGVAPASEAAMPDVEPERAEPTPAPIPSGAVARGTFTTAIEQREPIDSVTSVESDEDRVYYFNEYVGISGRRVVHRWEFDGEVVAEVPIEIGGPRWRAHSSKGLDASRLGEWTVSVVDESGHVVRTDSFVYEAPAPEPEIAAPTSASATPATPAAPAPGDAGEADRPGSVPQQP